MATITDEEKKSIAEDVKKQLLASAKSVQDFEKITELPESGSVTVPVVQADGQAKTFDIGNWLRNNQVQPANIDFVAQVNENGLYVTDEGMNVGMQLTDDGFDAIGLKKSSGDPSVTPSNIEFDVLGTI